MKGRMVHVGTHRVTVEAPRELTYQVVAGAGRVLERPSEYERVVEFTLEVKGETIRTVELVTLEPSLIRYRWLEGPLPSVQESIQVQARGDRSCELVYEGRFETPHGGARGWIEGRVIRRMFRRIVAEHLEEAKRIAERRGARSTLFGTGG